MILNEHMHSHLLIAGMTGSLYIDTKRAYAQPLLEKNDERLGYILILNEHMHSLVVISSLFRKAIY